MELQWKCPGSTTLNDGLIRAVDPLDKRGTGTADPVSGAEPGYGWTMSVP
jgi:hypothetical protein